MDVCESEKVLEKHSKVETTRTRLPLLPAENKNGTVNRLRTREVNSRYRSPTPSSTTVPKRSPSPIASRTSSTSALPTPKRAISAERKRPSKPSSPPSPSATTPTRDTSAELLLASRKIAGNKLPESLWPSTMRSLSVSFQSDATSIPVSIKEKQVSHTISDRTLRPSSNVAQKQGDNPLSRKPTPERKISPLRGKNSVDQSENSKPVDGLHSRLVDQHRWPGRATGKVSSSMMNKSFDLGDKGSKIPVLFPSRPRSPSLRRLSLDGATKPLQKSASDLLMQLSSDDSSLRLRKTGSSISSDRSLTVNAAARALASPTPASLPSPPPTSRGASPSRHRTIIPPSRIPSPSRQPARPSSPSRQPLRPSSPSRQPVRPSSPSNSRQPVRPASPSRQPVRPSSPSRQLVRPSSPSRQPVRPSSPSRQPQSSTSVLSFIADIKGKKAANDIEDVHQLRLLYNRQIQWRFANAQSDAALRSQKSKAEKILFSVWRTIGDLRHSVIEKKTELQKMKLKLMLHSVLTNQLSLLDERASIERDHTNSLTWAIQDLQASTIRVPVTGGAKGDIETLKAAICSAVDVMQAMGSSLRSVLSRVEAMNSLVSELADVAAHERAMIIECELLLGSTAALQVEENSLRTHLVQMKEAFGQPSSMLGY